MKSNFSNLANKYRAQAGKFNNADGAGVLKDSFMGQRRSDSFLGQASRMSNADGAGAPGAQFSKLADMDRIYTAILENTKTTGGTVTCTLFGFNEYGVTNDQIGGVNGTNGAYVTISETSHAQVRAQSSYSPFWVNGIRFRTTTAGQMSYNGTLQSKDSAGSIQSSQFRPLTYFTAAQNQNLQVDAPGLAFQIDGTVSFLLPVLANETVTMVLQVGGRFTPQNTLDNASPLQVASQNPLPTGTTTVIVGQ